MLFAALMLGVLPSALRADPKDDLVEAEAQIAAAPDNPEAYQKKCQALFAAGMEQKAIDFAFTAMQKYIAAGDSQKGMVLGSFKTDKNLIYVVYNMSRRERMQRGMTYPYGFHIYSLDDPPKFFRRLDWEVFYTPSGQPSSAAVGWMTPNAHVNNGGLPPDADYATVKALVLDAVSKEEVAALSVFGAEDDPAVKRLMTFLADAYPPAETLLQENTPKPDPARERLTPEMQW